MNLFEKTLQEKINQSGCLDFQGLKVSVAYKGKSMARLDVGKTYSFYDVASLTKILFTTLWFMQAHQKGLVSLKKKVSDYLPWYRGDALVFELLNHSAGNNWWQPFFKKISTDLPPVQAFQQLEKLCQAAEIQKTDRAIYSDIDFFLLGSIMQKLSQKPLSEVWQELKEIFYPKSVFHFNGRSARSFPKKQYAPTENCSWRKQTLQGVVHDENAWSIGGIAPHAGLFGGISDLESYGFLLRNIYLGRWNKLISAETLSLFAKRSLPKNCGDWGLGFMLPSLKGSSAGDLMSRKSIGHTGFTGTSFWMDLEKDLFVSLLSNRVHPTRDNKGFVRLRPMIHNWVVEYLEAK